MFHKLKELIVKKISIIGHSSPHTPKLFLYTSTVNDIQNAVNKIIVIYFQTVQINRKTFF